MNAALSPPSLRVFLVEDSPLVRERLAAMISAIPGVAVVGVAEEPVAALDGIGHHRADIAIVDLHLAGGTSGLTILQALTRGASPVASIVLTNAPYPQLRDACLSAGAWLFLDKATDMVLLRDTLERLTYDRELARAHGRTAG
jgi:DNA-binding NarL/FixJ family response regulator